MCALVVCGSRCNSGGSLGSSSIWPEKFPNIICMAGGGGARICVSTIHLHVH
jgi:hypothetical protein